MPCTGAVRKQFDQLMVLYFHDQLKLNPKDKPAAVAWTVNLMPLVAVLGSFSAGIITDKIFKGHRSPVAMACILSSDRHFNRRDRSSPLGSSGRLQRGS